MTEYSKNDTPKIKSKDYCEYLKGIIKQDNEYIDSINFLYQKAEEVFSDNFVGKNGSSILSEVQTHIEKIEEEIAK